jgi:hypothetical protein
MHTTETGMAKLLMSQYIPVDVGSGMRFIEDPRILQKSASTIFGCDYSTMAPDKDHVGIHVVGLGDFETYGANRNGDSFPKMACIKFHDTFVKHGSVFRNHNNKDRAARLGQIVKSAYNPDMGRIELFLHVHKEKAAEELQKLARDGEHAFSMACRVPFDRCNICNTLRKSASDDGQCDHVRYELRQTRRDGSLVCTHNDTPTFFDMSFVRRPADRIAWDLKMASGELPDSIKLAESEGLWIPDSLAITTSSAREKLALFEKLADYQRQYFTGIGPGAIGRYTWELRKAAAHKLSDAQIQVLRGEEPTYVLAKLAEWGVILPAESFFKYAFGLDYGELAPHMPAVLDYIRNGMFIQLQKSGMHQGACTNPYFDVDPISAPGYSCAQDSGVWTTTKAALLKEASFVGETVSQRVIEKTIAGEHIEIREQMNMKIASADLPVVEKTAEIYAAYKLSALQSIKAQRQTDEHTLMALSAAQDLAT